MKDMSRSADQRTTGTGQVGTGAAGTYLVRSLLAYGLVLFSPSVAWLVWISWSTDKATDAAHVAWFATVAISCLVAGSLAPRTAALYLPLFLLAPAAAMITLYLWWSSTDSNGLFMVGIVIATPMVVIAAVALLLVGHNMLPLRPKHHT